MPTTIDHVHKYRRDKDHVQATQRDLRMMTFIAHMEAVRRDHLRIAFSEQPGAPLKGEYLAESTLKDQIERYRKAGWIEYQRYLSEPGWSWATKKGLELVGLDRLYTARPPAAVRYHHLWAISEVRLHWFNSDEDEELEPGEWVSERWLRAELSGLRRRKNMINADEEAYKPAPVKLVEPGGLPDALYVGDDWCDVVEVELTPKKPEELRAKLERLCLAQYERRFSSTGRFEFFDEIHFCVPSQEMYDLVERAVAKVRPGLGCKERVHIILDKDLLQQKSS